MGVVLGFPYAPRPGQAELVDALQAAFAAGGHALVEAPTGSGKTVCALVAARQAGVRRLLVATRTNAQQELYVREQARLGGPGLLVPFMGRRHYCPLLKDRRDLADGTAEELGRLCRDAKRKALLAAQEGRTVEGACPYYARFLADGPGPVEALVREGHPGPQLARRITAAGSCPYESLKALLPGAAVVLVPQAYLIEAPLRSALLQWMAAPADEVDLLIDEAHHIPEAARDHASPALSVVTLRRALKEAEECGDPTLGGRVLATSFLDALHRIFHLLAARFAQPTVPDGVPDGLVPDGALEEQLLERLHVPSPTLGRIVRDLEALGEAVRTRRRQEGRLPRSYLAAVAQFLHLWPMLRDEPYVHLVEGGPQPRLACELLEPALALAWLEEFRSTVHQSGTLAPLVEHERALGIHATKTTVPDTLAPGRLALTVVRGLSSSHHVRQQEPAIHAAQADRARAILAETSVRTGLFFPSHAMLTQSLEEGLLYGLDRPVYVERQGMDLQELAGLVTAFCTDPRGGILVGVLGGRLTEGLDFPGDAMEQAVIMGIPYPPPSARLEARVRHAGRHDGQGWMRAVHHPVGRILRQAVGRLVRGPDDRGAAVFLDERAMRFTEHLRGLEWESAPCIPTRR